MYVFHDVSTVFMAVGIWENSKADLALTVTSITFETVVILSRFQGEKTNLISLKSDYKKSTWDRKYDCSHLWEI